MANDWADNQKLDDADQPVYPGPNDPEPIHDHVGFPCLACGAVGCCSHCGGDI
jgi:hypothetical protein